MVTVATILTAKAFKVASMALFVDGVLHLPNAVYHDVTNDRYNMPETAYATAKAGLGTIGMYAYIAAMIL